MALIRKGVETTQGNGLEFELYGVKVRASGKFAVCALIFLALACLIAWMVFSDIPVR